MFKIFLDRMAPPVDIKGEIVRAGDRGLGLKFVAIDPENLFHIAEYYPL